MPEPKETIGQRLKHIRTERRISLEKASEATRVRPYYLQALEEDNYSVMSSTAQGRGFLKLYADFLGLDLEAATNELRHIDSADAPPEPPAVEPASPALEHVPPAPPASPTATAVRRPFWARLLRRASSEADVKPEPEFTPEAEFVSSPEVMEESVQTPLATPEPEPEPTKPVRARMSTAKSPSSKSDKAKASKKTTKPKAKTTSLKSKRADDKKKVSLKKSPVQQSLLKNRR